MAAAVLASLFLVSAEASAAVPLASHRAVYDLSLNETAAGSGIGDVAGRMVLEFVGTECDGYTLNMRIVTRFLLRNGNENIADTRTTSWESGDGREFRFSTQQYVNNTITEDSRGNAERGEGGEPGKAVLEKPERKEVLLPAETVFPVEHTRRIIDKALAGELMDHSLVYDGSEDQRPMFTVTFVGEKRPAGSVELPESIGDIEGLAKLPAWPVTVSYFGSEAERSGEQTPEHELSFLLFENGIASDVTLSYSDFSLEGELRQLAIIPQPPCD